MKICSILSLGPSFFVSLFWHPPCVCFSVLGIAAISLPGLVEWPNVVGFVGSSGITSPITQAWPSRCACHVDCVHPPLTVEFWLLLVRHCDWFTPRLISFKDWLQPPTTNLLPLWKISCAAAHPTEQDLPQWGSGACWVLPLSVTWGGWLVALQCSLKLPSGCAHSGASRKYR